MKIKRARRLLRGQLSDYAKKQFDDYCKNLRPTFWDRLKCMFSAAYKKQWRESRITAFVRRQNRNMKRIAKRAERRIAYGIR